MRQSFCQAFFFRDILLCLRCHKSHAHRVNAGRCCELLPPLRQSAAGENPPVTKPPMYGARWRTPKRRIYLSNYGLKL